METESRRSKNRATSLELVKQFAESMTMFKSFGASPYGGDLTKWPSRVLDAFLVLQEEHTRVENLKVVQTTPRR